jgi:hypothetical protein
MGDMETKYVVIMKRRIERRAEKMPQAERQARAHLIADLREGGPVQKD